MSQAKRSRRMNSLFVNSSKLDSLSEPINKAIKPSQIYNDYSIPVKALSPDRGNSFIKQTRSPVMQSLDLSHSHCTCDCHRKLNDFSDSSVSTANSKRSKMLTPSNTQLEKYFQEIHSTGLHYSLMALKPHPSKSS